MTNDRIVTGVKTLGGNDPWAQGQSFMTVEQLQAQIASLTAENERLRATVAEQAQESQILRVHIKNLLAILDTAYAMPDSTKQFLEEVRQIGSARAALQPKEGNQ